MRLHPSRVFSILPLFALLSLSLLVCLVHGLTHEQSDAVARHARQLSGKRSIFARQGGGGLLGAGGDDEDAAPSSSASAGSSSSSVASPSPSTTPESSTSASGRSTTTSFSTTPSFSTSSSVTPSSTSSESSSSTSSTSSSSSTSTSRPSTSRTSSSSTTSSSRTTLQVTSLPTSTSTSVVVATPTLVRSISSSATSSVAETSAVATSSETGSSSGFLSNTGAVVGTFTAVGIVAVAGICAVVLFIRKRKRNEELDIFDTEYRDYSTTGNDLGGSSGNADYFASDMTALSSNAVTHAGSHTRHEANSDYNHIDFGYGAPAPADRDSIASNHAGYGAFRAATEQRKPPTQGSGLRNEVAWSSDAPYVEPAVSENQSIHVTPNNEDAYYAAAVRVPGSAY